MMAVEAEGAVATLAEDEEGSLPWLWRQLTSSRSDATLTFWVTQILGLLSLAGMVWGFGAVWDHYVDERVGKVVDGFFDILLRISWPIQRLLDRYVSPVVRPLLWHLIGRWLPKQLEHALCLTTLLFLAFQHGNSAAAAASTKGIFRTEVTPLAVGAMRAQWGCTRLRMQDGALAHKLIEIAIVSGQWMSAEFNSTWGVGSKRWLNASIACLRTATDDTTPLSQSAVIQDICTACADDAARVLAAAARH